MQVGGLGEGNRGQPRPLVRGSTRSRKVCLYFYTTSVYSLSASVFRPMCLDVGSLITLYTQKASASRCSTTSTITMLPHPCKKSPPGDVGRIAGIPSAFRARFSLPPAPGPSSARAGPSPPLANSWRRVSQNYCFAPSSIRATRRVSGRAEVAQATGEGGPGGGHRRRGRRHGLQIHLLRAQADERDAQLRRELHLVSRRVFFFFFEGGPTTDRRPHLGLRQPE